MTELQTGRPEKGAWKKDTDFCTKRGNHLYKVKTKRIDGSLKTVLVCGDCGFTVPTVPGGQGKSPVKKAIKVRGKR